MYMVITIHYPVTDTVLVVSICSPTLHMNSPVDSNQVTLKLLLMGDSGTGKSSILLRFCDDQFLGEDVQAATIGTLM